MDVAGGQRTDDHGRTDGFQALHDVEKSLPVQGPDAVRGGIGQDAVANGLELELPQKQMERLLGVQIGPFGMDQLAVDGLVRRQSVLLVFSYVDTRAARTLARVQGKGKVNDCGKGREYF